MTKTLTNRKWICIGVIGNILMLAITGSAVSALSYVGYVAISSTNGAYEFWHQSTLKELILAAIAIVIVVLIFATCLVLSLKCAWRLLKFSCRSLYKMLKRQMQKESDKIQETLRRKQAKAIFAIGKGIDRKIERGRCIKKRKEIL